jgi:hypothetical protein
LRSLERTLRREAGDGAGQAPRHEYEDLHRLDAHLKALRRTIEDDRTLRQTFNVRGGHRTADDDTDPPRPDAPGTSSKPDPGQEG